MVLVSHCLGLALLLYREKLTSQTASYRDCTANTPRAPGVCPDVTHVTRSAVLAFSPSPRPPGTFMAGHVMWRRISTMAKSDASGTRLITGSTLRNRLFVIRHGEVS